MLYVYFFPPTFTMMHLCITQWAPLPIGILLMETSCLRNNLRNSL